VAHHERWATLSGIFPDGREITSFSPQSAPSDLKRYPVNQ
jgi:hypothetical protein